MKERGFFDRPRLHRRADYVLNYSELASREAAYRSRGAHGRKARRLVRLVAVSKTFASQAVREAAQAGLRHFGENYVTEGVEKIRELRSLGLTWHYIGPIQSNKTRLIGEYFDWVHSIDREKSPRGSRKRAARDRRSCRCASRLMFRASKAKAE